MIDLTNWLILKLKENDSCGGRAYRAWPQKSVSAPYCVLIPIARVVQSHDADGSEVSVRQTWSIAVFADRASTCDAIHGELADALAPFHFDVSGGGASWDENTLLYRVDMTYDVAVDRRGMTWSR